MPSVQPTLIEKIKENQGNGVKLLSIIEEVQNGEKSEFNV